MTYVFQLADTGAPGESLRGCAPALIVFAILFLIIACIFLVATGLIIVVALVVMYYFVPIAIGVLLVIAALVVSAVRRPASDSNRYLVVDEDGFCDRFRAAVTRHHWRDIAAVEVAPPLLIVKMRSGYPARYTLAPTNVDAATFSAFCREQIAAHESEPGF